MRAGTRLITALASVAVLCCVGSSKTNTIVVRQQSLVSTCSLGLTHVAHTHSCPVLRNTLELACLGPPVSCDRQPLRASARRVCRKSARKPRSRSRQYSRSRTSRIDANDSLYSLTFPGSSSTSESKSQSHSSSHLSAGSEHSFWHSESMSAFPPGLCCRHGRRVSVPRWLRRSSPYAAEPLREPALEADVKNGGPASRGRPRRAPNPAVVAISSLSARC
jgi:hypothetical protein